jgi:hypothetical protein
MPYRADPWGGDRAGCGVSEAMNGPVMQSDAGRPADWPDLPVEMLPTAPSVLSEPEPTVPSKVAPILEEPATPVFRGTDAPAEPLENLEHEDGTWTGETAHWTVRVVVESNRFEGSAHCLLRNLRYRIAGRVTADGSIEGSAKASRATFQPVSTDIRGQWPTMVLPSATHCREESVPLTPS